MKRCIATLLFIGAVLATSPVFAGPFTNDMAECLVRSTTPAERNELMRWMFVAIDQHPAVRSLAQIPRAQRTAIARKTGALFQRLITVSCRTQVRRAVQYEGPASIQVGFEALGSAAARGLFTDPHVAQYMAGMARYLDKKKLAQALGPLPTAAK